MAKNKKTKPSHVKIVSSSPVNVVPSLLDKMEDGNEFGSIVNSLPHNGLDLVSEMVRAIEDISNLRGRPCLAYLGNVVRQTEGYDGIDTTDDLPFFEMVKAVPATERKVDVLLSTKGGSAHQVNRFVTFLRQRFDEVDFLIPSMCMSAGTIFALSGDRIWMTPLACLGPIDPQIPTRDGRYVPAQALLLLVAKLQSDGQTALNNGQPIPWTSVRTLDSIDKKELADAISATDYSTTMTSQFLINYKFRHWTTRSSSGIGVTREYREQRARDIGMALASHEQWKSHGHAISRDVLWDEIKLKIDHPDPQLDRALTRAWALAHWYFDKTSILKMIVSSHYRYVKGTATQQVIQ